MIDEYAIADLSAICTEARLARLNADIDSRPTLSEIEASSVLALEATLTAIKGAGWSTETLKEIAEYVDALETRLSAARAGYLDNLSAGAVALASICTEARLAELAAANLPADIDSILADTNELQADWVNGGRLDLLLDRVLEAIEIKQASVNDAAASTTEFVTNLTETVNDFWNRNSLIFTSGNCKGQMRKIHTYNGTTKKIILYTALSYAPANSDTFVIVAARNFRMNLADISQIVDDLWDELQSGHVVAGSFGKYLDTEVSGVVNIGPGALSCTWTQKDDQGVPMDNCQIWITTDDGGTNVIAGTLLTNASGEATFMLDAGAYYVWREKGGYNFTNPQTWMVS
jgi:hypothetical protein